MTFDPGKFYTTKELAQMLRIAEVTARSYCRSGRLPSQKFGKGWRVLGQHIIDYLKSSQTPDTKEAQTIIELK